MAMDRNDDLGMTRPNMMADRDPTLDSTRMNSAYDRDTVVQNAAAKPTSVSRLSIPAQCGGAGPVPRPPRMTPS